MSIDLAERNERDRAIGVVLALTASSMLGATLAFARVALAARGGVPHIAWGLAVTAGWLFVSIVLSRKAAPRDEVERQHGRSAFRVVLVFATLLELASILSIARRASPLVTALFAWHAAHAGLAAITGNPRLTRFTALSWFALALAVWGLA